jgi:hypothetical protein
MVPQLNQGNGLPVTVVATAQRHTPLRQKTVAVFTMFLLEHFMKEQFLTAAI